MSDADDLIFLVGFMGAGKSVSGASLARRLGWEFIDLDQLVGDREGCSIAELFGRDGEEGFRQAEIRALHTLSGRHRLIVACGGGTYAHPEGRARIDAMGRAIWIDTPLPVSLQRCSSGQARPLLQDETQAESLYQARLPAYRRAPFRIDAVDATPEEIAERIIALLGSGP